MNMKVSSLFNGKEFQKELDKIKQYMNMLGQSDRKIIITLDNDIGTDGEIYDRAKFDVKRNETIRSELSKKVPGYELQFVEVKEDGIIITGVNGGGARRRGCTYQYQKLVTQCYLKYMPIVFLRLLKNGRVLHLNILV